MIRRLGIDDLVKGVLEGNRLVLSRALSLAESSHFEDKVSLSKLVKKISGCTGKSVRIAVSGIPGSGKSTLIDKLGAFFISQGHKVAVISVDPASPLSGGSILGDKTRMEVLSRSKNAFVRPISAGNLLGGIAVGTRESILLFEAAGFDVIFVETVGVGQSETEALMVTDLFILLMLTGGGDELQSIKRGIMEVPDAIVVNKADQGNEKAAEGFLKELRHSFHAVLNRETAFFKVSSIEDRGVLEICNWILNLKKAKSFSNKRKKQNVYWLKQLLKQALWDWFLSDASVHKQLEENEVLIGNGDLLPQEGAEKLLGTFKENWKL